MQSCSDPDHKLKPKVHKEVEQLHAGVQPGREAKAQPCGHPDHNLKAKVHKEAEQLHVRVKPGRDAKAQPHGHPDHKIKAKVHKEAKQLHVRVKPGRDAKGQPHGHPDHEIKAKVHKEAEQLLVRVKPGRDAKGQPHGHPDHKIKPKVHREAQQLHVRVKPGRDAKGQPCGHADHKLELEQNVPPYICSSCWQLGFYSRYSCRPCRFYLHVDCQRVVHKPAITHAFFPSCNLSFLKSPVPDPFGRRCDACGLDIRGYNYHCLGKGWDLHPCCANLPWTKVMDCVVLELRQELPSKCNKCGERAKNRKTWCYVSKCGECQLHVACVMDMVLENWKLMEVSESTAVARREPSLRIVNDKGKKMSGERFGKYAKIVKIALSFIMSALMGDPTTFVVGVLSALFSG